MGVGSYPTSGQRTRHIRKYLQITTRGRVDPWGADALPCPPPRYGYAPVFMSPVYNEAFFLSEADREYYKIKKSLKV